MDKRWSFSGAGGGNSNAAKFRCAQLAAANCGKVEEGERLVCSLLGSCADHQYQNKKTAQGGLFVLVPVVGLEPTRYRYQRILSRIRRLESASIFWKQIECYAQINTMKSDFSRFCVKKSGRKTESLFCAFVRNVRKKRQIVAQCLPLADTVL